jgi:hypothetical protein
MDESKRRAVRFLEKEIKTYKALVLFLSKEEIKKHLQVKAKKVHPPNVLQGKVARGQEARK